AHRSPRRAHRWGRETCLYGELFAVSGERPAGGDHDAKDPRPSRCQRNPSRPGACLSLCLHRRHPASGLGRSGCEHDPRQMRHVPKVKRPVAEGGSEKMVASHIWRGGSDPAMLKKAVTFESSVKPDGTVIVNVTDTGAGHKFPTGIHFREADVVVTVTDASGK